MKREIIEMEVRPPRDTAFDSCNDCVHCDDAEEICVLRRCVHAFGNLKECYKPKSGQESEFQKKARACAQEACYLEQGITQGIV